MKKYSDNIKYQVVSAFKRIFCLALCLLFTVCVFAGCEKNASVLKYNYDGTLQSIGNCHIAKTDRFMLSWNDNAKAVILTDSQTGKMWSSIGYDSFLAGDGNENLESSLAITVSNTITCKQDIFLSSSISRTGGDIIAEKIKGGVRVTYYFDNVKIAVPVEYTLRKNGVKVSIDSTQIKEDGTNYEILSANVAPFMCSANNLAEDSYIFVPSGTGALMSVNNTAEGDRTWSGEVYGRDYACQIERNHNYKAQVNLPVFGVKEGNNALFGIIENGAESAVINAQAGNERLGYSSVYPTFKFRSEDIYYFASNATGHTTLNSISDEICTTKFEVGYYPLINEEANYNYMAKFYQNYLLSSGQLNKSESIYNPYSITIHGGTKIAKSTLGVPGEELVALTTLKDAKAIVENINKEIGVAPIVRLNDFGDNGLTPGTINGGKEFADVYGSKKDAKALAEYCKTAGINLFLDLDVVRYNFSGNGFSTSGDIAKNALGTDAEQKLQTPQMILDENNIYKILSRASLDKAVDKAINKVEKYGIEGISLSTLTMMAYSDQNDNKYNARNNMGADVQALIKKVKDSEHPVAASNANAYAAGLADVIFDLEVRNGDEIAFSELVPFYQMVFAGYKPMYVAAINMSDNFDEQLMLAASTGMGIDFSIIDKFEVNSTQLGHYSIYSCEYEGNKELISNILKDNGYIDYYNSVKGATIEKYTLLANNVSATSFSNGVTVYANHTAYDVESPIGTLKAYEYKVGKEVEENNVEQEQNPTEEN